MVRRDRHVPCVHDHIAHAPDYGAQRSYTTNLGLVAEKKFSSVISRDGQRTALKRTRHEVVPLRRNSASCEECV